MLAAERNVVDSLYPLIIKKTAFSFVQRPKPYAPIQSGFRPVGGDRYIRFPLLQKKYRATTSQPRGKSQRITGFPPSVPDRHRKLFDVQLILKIRNELKRLEKSFRHSDFPQFATSLRTELQSWDGKAALPVLVSLRHAWKENGEDGLKMQIKYLFQGHVAHRNFTKSDLEDQEKLADLRFPVDWYPEARKIHRSIHLHVGPTNSGKTYRALKRLENARSGIYASPLRLLAHEVYTRLNAKGIPCNLVTGDERLSKEGDNAKMLSCTVEMLPLHRDVDVAIIDEIQLIGCKWRGWAWTQALMGCMAKEIHLCGEARTIPLIRELATLMGDSLEIHHYERLSPLEVMPISLNGNLASLEKGDCIVVFSKKGIHMMKRDIQRITKKRVATVYGDLPPETRVQQARLFNEPDNNYDFLVASDAIGMGLNLRIKRIIFESTVKNSPRGFERLKDHEIKQIGGRAGRFRGGAQVIDDGSSPNPLNPPNPPNPPNKPHGAAATESTEVGLVTSLTTLDYPHVMRGMRGEPMPVMTAGIKAPDHIIARFAAFFPLGTPLSYVLHRINELALMHPRFHACDIIQQATIANIIEVVKDLTITDRLTFCEAPVNRTGGLYEVCRALAQCVANNGGGGLLEINELDLDVLDRTSSNDPSFRSRLEDLHKALCLYMWLGYRFEGVFHDREMASYAKQLVQERIEHHLATARQPRMSSASRARRQEAEKQKRKMTRMAHAETENKNILRANHHNGNGNGNPNPNPNTSRNLTLPPEARDALAQSTQPPTDRIIELEFLRNPLPETRPTVAAA